jgi:3-methyladenine DNA glycosylase AlkC
MELKQMFNQTFVTVLATAIEAAYPPFDTAAFISRVFDTEWESRELKARMRHISTTLHDFLPADYPAALHILHRAALHLGEYGFEKMIFPDYVEVYGLDNWSASLPMLEEFTKFASAEFAVRPFLARDLTTMMQQMETWSQHTDFNVRRLASEGCRPRLPWAMRVPALIRDPAPIVPILERLKDDEAETVRRSVANNLNDIAKDHPAVVVDLLQRWQPAATPEVRWVINHALRSLVKQGHNEALTLLGYGAAPQVVVRNLVIEPAIIPLGGEARFSFEVVGQGDQPQELVIDYVLHYQKANGKLAPKVFKLSKITVQPEQVVTLRKTISFRPITTRTYYPGAHTIAPQINGVRYPALPFEVSG